MSDAPLVSVLMPVRNGGAWLTAAVGSILGQSFRRLELILVDDRSSDGAVAELDRSDQRLRVIDNRGEGIVAALNAGAAAASAPMLARMDADDIALPNRIERQFDWLRRHRQIAIAGTEVEVFGGTAPPREGYRVYERWLNALRAPRQIAEAMFIESPIPHPSAMFSRAVFRELGGYRDVNWSEDYDLWLRAHAAGYAFGKPDGVLLRWRDSPGRLSRSDPRCQPASFMRAKAHFLAATLLRERNATIWAGRLTGTRLHDCLRAEGVRVNGFVDVDPRRTGAGRRGLPVRTPEQLKASDRTSLLLAAVGNRGASEKIAETLRRWGWTTPTDFVMLA